MLIDGELQLADGGAMFAVEIPLPLPDAVARCTGRNKERMRRVLVTEVECPVSVPGSQIGRTASGMRSQFDFYFDKLVVRSECVDAKRSQADRVSSHRRIVPPSTFSTWPFIQAPSSDIRKATREATSSGVPTRGLRMRFNASFSRSRH
jgi:hypothetical protein